MNTYDIVSLLCAASILVFLPWRFFRLKRLSESDERIFVAFWVWPLLWCAFHNGVPIWATWGWLFQATEILILAGLLLDFVYYFGMKTKALRAQLLSALLLLPCLVVVFRDRFVSDPVVLVVPYYDKALVWTDGVYAPQTWFFMEPETRIHGSREHAYDDPNFGKAIFSPLAGEVVSVDETSIELRGKDATVRLSPLVKGSITLAVGARVIENQPLGLLGTGTPPGLRLDVISDREVRFADVYAGRWWAGRYEAGMLKRNVYVQSDAPTRFQVNPITQ
jgi:hypothetical protein